MPKTYRVPHYVLGFETGSPKTKGFEDKDEMLRFLATTKRTVIELKINGAKKAPSTLSSQIVLAKQKFGENRKRDFSQIALSVAEKATGGPLKQ